MVRQHHQGQGPKSPRIGTFSTRGRAYVTYARVQECLSKAGSVRAVLPPVCEGATPVVQDYPSGSGMSAAEERSTIITISPSGAVLRASRRKGGNCCRKTPGEIPNKGRKYQSPLRSRWCHPTTSSRSRRQPLPLKV